jgi:hypothetical protein
LLAYLPVYENKGAAAVRRVFALKIYFRKKNFPADGAETRREILFNLRSQREM